MDNDLLIAIRVQFACAALQGMLANAHTKPQEIDAYDSDFAEAAFRYADLMMAKLQESF